MLCSCVRLFEVSCMLIGLLKFIMLVENESLIVFGMGFVRLC